MGAYRVCNAFVVSIKESGIYSFGFTCDASTAR